MDRLASSRIAGSRVLARGGRFDFIELRVLGREGEEHIRQVVRHPGAVVVLPVLAGRGGPEIVFVSNYRAAIDRRLLELPAGTLEAGEGPEACARRELVEETGYRAEQLRPLGAFYTTPGLTNERMHAYVATGLAAGGADPDDEEDLEVVIVPLDEVWRRVDAGEIPDAKTQLTLLLADRQGLLE